MLCPSVGLPKCIGCILVSQIELHMRDGEFRKCDLDDCTRRMRKVRTGRGGIILSKQHMLEGFGGAEECQQCGALHCDVCYQQRDNVCVRCHQRALRLVMVQYETGTTALWPQPPVPVVPNSCAGSSWAISLRKFLATQGQSHLEAATTQLGAELSALPPARSGFSSFFDKNIERRALESAWSTMQKVALEDRSPAVPQSEATANLLRRCGRPDDAESVLLISPDWQVRMGQSYMMAPAFIQDQLLRSGLDACKRCAAIVRSLGDAFCEAEYLTRLGNGLYSARRLEEAEAAFTDALGLWRGLAQNDPELLVKVGRTLQHLGTTQSARGEYTRCASSYREAIEVLESCAADGHRDLTAVLNNLGTFHLHRREYESASSCFDRACSILEALIGFGVTRSTEDPFSPLLSMQLTRVRGNLALCLGELGDLDRAAELIEQTIRDDVNHQADGGDQVSLQLAKSHATLGRIRLQRWTSESHYGEIPLDDLLDGALNELSLATNVFREHLQMSNLAAYLPAIIDALTAHGLALGYHRNFGPAAEIIDEACHLANSPSLWFERMKALDARRELEVTRQREPTAGFEYARRAMETAEKGMAALSESERVNRDLVKSRVEMSYLSCVANLTRRKDYEDLFHVLEAMRRIDRLAQGAGHSVAEIDLRSAKALARKHSFTYIASQAAPGGTVFFVIHAEGEVTAEPAVQGWADKAFQFSTEIDNAARALEFFGAPDLENFTNQAASLFDDLPANAKRALATESRPIFLSMGGDQHNLPMELLYDRNSGWLGLQRVYARTRSFEELASILERQPATKSPSAVVAAGPGEDFEKIVRWPGSSVPTSYRRGFRCSLRIGLWKGMS
jgi:tetratricopeptide (TPR) repeat protein